LTIIIKLINGKKDKLQQQESICDNKISDYIYIF